MRIVFFGTAEFSVPSLRACAFRHDVAAVVTQPDRPGSRGRPAPRPVADAARALGLPLLQPERLRAPEAVEAVLALEPDALVVAAYGQILPVALLDRPRCGGINVHASLLPRWRGASPIARAILEGDETTGVCIMRMEAGLDTGPVYARRETPVPPRVTAPELTDELAVLGAELLAETLPAIDRGALDPVPQPEVGVTLAPRLTRDDGLVDWSRDSALRVDRMIRALTPWPGVTAELAGERVRLVAAEPAGGAAEAGHPGEIVSRGQAHIDVATADGVLRVTRIQPPGRTPMDPAAWLRGRR